MIVTIHQPEHLPWLGFFNKLDSADILILLDTVSFRKNYFQNRNRILSASGPVWLTVPIYSKGRFGQKIIDVQINNETTPRWPAKCSNSIIQCYKKASFFKTYEPFFESLYSRTWTSLVDLNVTIINHLMNELGISTRILRASELRVTKARTDMLVDLCVQAGASIYLSGISGKQYLELDKFAEAGIEVLFQEFYHPIYKQVYDPFIPCMSVIDLMFNCGPDSGDILRGIGVSTLEHVFE